MLRGRVEALAEGRERGADEGDGGFDLRGDPEGAAVGVELGGDEHAHFELEPWGWRAGEICVGWVEGGKRGGGKLTSWVDVGVTLHFNDKDCELVRGGDAGAAGRSVLGRSPGRMQRNSRCSEHKDDTDTQAPFEGHLKLPDGPQREDEQDDVEGHAGAIQRHLRVIVIPVLEVQLPFQRVPGHVERAADEGGQDGVDDQVKNL